MSDLRFGWYIPTHGDGVTAADHVPPTMDLFLDVAHAAERAGMEYALVPVATGCYEAWVATSMISARTTRLKMLVAARPGIIGPTQMARMVSTFDQLSQGRVMVNLIAGGGQAEMAADGVFYDHDERYALMDEVVEIMKRAWLEPGSFDYEGRFYRLLGARVEPKPYQQPYPPFYIGGISEAAQDVGAKHASCYLFWGNTPEQIARDLAAVRERAAAHGRADELRYGMRFQVCVRRTEEEARAAAEALIAPATDRQREARMKLMGAESAADGRMRQFALATAANNYWISRHLYAGLTTIRHGAGVMVVGNPEQVAETLQQYIDIGCSEFCLSGYPHAREAELFGELVMPYFRDRLAENRHAVAAAR